MSVRGLKLIFKPVLTHNSITANGETELNKLKITIDATKRSNHFEVNSITFDNDTLATYLDTKENPSTPYTPQYPGSPATKKYVDDSIPTKVSDLTNDSDFQTATQVNQAISTAVSSAYKYKGSVANQAALPVSGNTTGDVWNTEDTGMNYAWTGSAWDALGATVDMSNYVAKDNTTAFTPSGDYNPATKKYVDDTVASAKSTGATAPSNPTEGQLWYDTTNDLLKSYNGSSWDVVGDESADINTKTFYLSSTSDLTTAQAAYDWRNAGKNSIIIYSGNTYFQYEKDSEAAFYYKNDNKYESQSRYTLITQPKIKFNLSSGTVVSVSAIVGPEVARFLSTNVDYSTPYTPSYPGSPATKKYVDDSVSGAVSKGTTAPSSPIEGMLWYDTTNDVLKSYNGTTWVEVGGGATTNVLRFDIGERYGLNDLIGQSVANIVNAWNESGTGTEGKNTIMLTANDGQNRRYDFLVTSVTEWIPGPDEEQRGAIHAITYSNSEEFYDSMQQNLYYLDIYYNIDTKICTNIQEFTQSPTTRLDSPFPLDFIWLGTEADYQDINEPNPQTLYLTMDIPLKSYQEIVAMADVQDVYNELNLQPARYIQKFTSEGHFYNGSNGKWLSSDGTIGNIPTWGNYRVRVASGMDTFDYTTTTPA